MKEIEKVEGVQIKHLKISNKLMKMALNIGMQESYKKF